MYSKILIRYGELSTKGKNKISFIKHLEKNIYKIINIKPHYIFNRMFIPYSNENINNLQKIFGIQSYSPVVTCESDENSITNSILDLIKSTTAKTFKVEVHRIWKNFPKSSQTLNNILGSKIFEKTNIKIDVKKPELKIEIEIRNKETFIFIKRIQGLGGYPTGINGKILHLISGGIDSPVAAWKMMKRGIHVDFLNFITPPHTDSKTIEKVNKIIQLLVNYQGKTMLYRNKYTDLMNLIDMTSDQSYKITLMRRSFYRIASKLAIDNNYLGLSNGDNVGQVASQTLESMWIIGSQSLLQIYRPLLTFDKSETIIEAKKIGTYEISIEKANETCELFAPKYPVIKPFFKKIEELEKELSIIFELENKNYENNWEKLFFEVKK